MWHLSDIYDLLEEGRVKDAMNVIKRQDRIRKDNIRLWQALVNGIYTLKEEYKNWNLTESEIYQELFWVIFYMEDREFLKLIFEDES